MQNLFRQFLHFSPTKAYRLKEKKIYFCKAVKEHRQGFLKDVKSTKRSEKEGK